MKNNIKNSLKTIIVTVIAIGFIGITIFLNTIVDIIQFGSMFS